MVNFDIPEEPDFQRIEVTLASGETMKVLNDVEARWFNGSLATYLQQTRFTETTDLRDLDRLLIQELMVFRWSQWLASDEDYVGGAVNEEQLRKNIKDYSSSIDALKEKMGLTKRARDDAANAGDFSRWFDSLLYRAEAFGIHRENQLQAALVLMNELSAVVGTFDRCDDEEREKIGFKTEHDILEWIRNTMLPEFKQIDEYFLENQQKMWREDTQSDD